MESISIHSMNFRLPTAAYIYCVHINNTDRITDFVTSFDMSRNKLQTAVLGLHLEHKLFVSSPCLSGKLSVRADDVRADVFIRLFSICLNRITRKTRTQVQTRTQIYAQTRQYTFPGFVFTIIVSRPRYSGFFVHTFIHCRDAMNTVFSLQFSIYESNMKFKFCQKINNKTSSTITFNQISSTYCKG